MYAIFTIHYVGFVYLVIIMLNFVLIHKTYIKAVTLKSPIKLLPVT